MWPLCAQQQPEKAPSWPFPVNGHAQSAATITLIPCGWILPVLERHVNTLWCVWFPSWSTVSLRYTPMLPASITHFFWVLRSQCSGVGTCYWFVYSFFCRWPLGWVSCFTVMNKTTLTVGNVCGSEMASFPELLCFPTNERFKSLSHGPVKVSCLPEEAKPFPSITNVSVFWGLLLHVPWINPCLLRAFFSRLLRCPEVWGLGRLHLGRITHQHEHPSLFWEQKGPESLAYPRQVTSFLFRNRQLWYHIRQS